VLRLPLTKSAKLIAKAIENNQREKDYKWWLARIPIYTKETYETFEEFREIIHPKPILYDQRSKDEIMNDLLNRKEE
jgi:hypothetical protein